MYIQKQTNLYLVLSFNSYLKQQTTPIVCTVSGHTSKRDINPYLTERFLQRTQYINDFIEQIVNNESVNDFHVSLIRFAWLARLKPALVVIINKSL
jgi:hypothetical protein